MIPSSVEYWAAFLVGLLGSVHCVGMCGPLAIACGARSAAGSSLRLRNSLAIHSAYGFGRVISYTTLGFLGGLAGGVFVSLRGISFWLNGILGMGMIAMGVLTLLSRSFTVSSSLRKERARWAPANLLAGVAGSENTGGGFALGILTPLLPCGMLYAMVMRASAEAQPVTGALLMLAYSLGTVPAMMIIGMVSSMGLMRFRGYAEMVAACAVILMGLLLLLKAFHAPSMTMVHG